MEHKCKGQSRRTFLKTSVAAGAVSMVSNCLISKDSDDGSFEKKWKSQGQINPNIDNLRVAYITDPAMIKSDPTLWTMEEQNEAVDTAVVHANMDKMAKALAQKTTAGESWATIFQKPEGKTWAGSKVGIKLNALKTNNLPKLAVITKLIQELNTLGVVNSNIILFDAGLKTWAGLSPGNNIAQYKGAYAASKLPQGIQAEMEMGGETTIELSHGGPCPCATWLTDGTIDVLINIAINKGHEQTEMLGGYTLTFKNHVGCMQFGGDPVDPRNVLDTLGHPTADRLIAMNLTKEILGSGSVAKQQLCIVDSLWASKLGPNADPDTKTSSLVMGTFSHAVDYATIKKIRKNTNLMTGITPINNDVVNQYWKAFGYDPANLNMAFVDAKS